MVDNTLSDETIKAIYLSDITKLREFLISGNIDDTDKDKRTAIFHAVLSGNPDTVRFFLDNQAALNLKDSAGWSPLHYAVQNHHTEIAEILLEHDADIEFKDDYGNTALWRAVFASKGRAEMIRLLISKGANPEVKNNSGVSPLKLAETIANYDVKQFFK